MTFLASIRWCSVYFLSFMSGVTSLIFAESTRRFTRPSTPLLAYTTTAWHFDIQIIDDRNQSGDGSF